MDLETRLLNLASSGFECSQILMILGLELENEENPDLVRMASGLTGGLGHCGKCCGTLTGGCCLLGYYLGRGEEEEMEHSRCREIIQEYVHWFEETFGSQYGGTDCQDIIGGDFTKCISLCAPMIARCFEKINELLTENGVL